MSDAIKDKVVVITGASSGLGEAAARLLASRGAKLMLGARRVDRVHKLARELGFDERAVVAFAIEQPADVDINEILFRPTAQEY